MRKMLGENGDPRKQRVAPFLFPPLHPIALPVECNSDATCNLIAWVIETAKKQITKIVENAGRQLSYPALVDDVVPSHLSIIPI
jgi:hypothetical protein